MKNIKFFQKGIYFDIMNYEFRLARVLGSLIGQNEQNLINLIKEANKNIDADYAINCFTLKRYINKDGTEIANYLKNLFTPDILSKNNFIESVTAIGSFLNFKINKNILAQEVILHIIKDIDMYARSVFTSTQKPKRIVIEYPSPNTNKPLHLGHVRNMLLGQALSNLNKYIGNAVFQTNLLNDRGVHICKSMWAYENYGNKSTPKSANRKSDFFVGDYYIKYAQEEDKLKRLIKDKSDDLEKEQAKPENERNQDIIKKLQEEISHSEFGKLENEIKNMLLAWENKDPKIRALWKKMNTWAEEGFNETFELFKIKHDKTYKESEIYDKGKEIVLKGLSEGVFEKLEDGAVAAKFTEKGLPPLKILLRRDGTTLYITQDLYLAFEKMKDFNYDISVYVVGNEQDMQLRTVFAILKKLGMKAENIHYSYGMINLTTGKMKSREGKVVDADDFVKELKDLSKDELKKRYPDLNEKEIDNRSSIIAMAAIRFFILKYEYSRDFIYDPEKSLAFEGETGPYILYSYARICSIFKKGMEKRILVPFNPDLNQEQQGINLTEIDFSLIKSEHELKLIDDLSKYPDILFESTVSLKPHILTRYLFELSQDFNTFYHSCKVLGEEDSVQNVRLILSEAIRRIIKNGLNILTIDVLNEM